MTVAEIFVEISETVEVCAIKIAEVSAVNMKAGTAVEMLDEVFKLTFVDRAKLTSRGRKPL